MVGGPPPGVATNHEPRESQVVMTLLRWGSVPDVAAREPGEKAYTPLHRAALSGHAEVARVLIKAGADKDARTGGSVASPLHLAARKV